MPVLNPEHGKKAMSARRRRTWVVLNLLLALLLLLAGRRALHAVTALGRDEAVVRSPGAKPRNVSLDGILARAAGGSTRPLLR
ncbi:MAG TPA: hypothetical protein VFQ39_17280, partial [Longimicrobium sp.]|nr:hypothetical protein [Longimicrobium sp.]